MKYYLSFAVALILFVVFPIEAIVFLRWFEPTDGERLVLFMVAFCVEMLIAVVGAISASEIFNKLHTTEKKK